MRKALSIVLALAMIMSLSITAFADETGVSDGYYPIAITGTYVAGTTTSEKVFSVDIAWEGMDFTYHAETAPVWNPKDHVYYEAVPAYWEGEGKITITNHSNAGVFVAIGLSYFHPVSDDFELICSDRELYLNSAEDAGNAVIGEITVTPSGSIPAGTSAGTKLAQITVIIEGNTEVTTEEAEALVALIRERTSAWNDAGLNNEDPSRSAITACHTISYTLEMEIEDMKNGTGDQKSLNSYYKDTLAAYEKVESYMPAN